MTALLAVGGICGFTLAARFLGSRRRSIPPRGRGRAGGIGGVQLSGVLRAVAVRGTVRPGHYANRFRCGRIRALHAHSGHADGQGAPDRACARCLGRRAGVSRRRRDRPGWPNPGRCRRTCHRAACLGEALREAQTGYSVVYHIEIALLFATLIALGPLVRARRAEKSLPSSFGLAGSAR